MDATLLTVIGSVLVAALSLGGVIYAARSSRAANARSEETKTWQYQLDALEKRANNWRDDVEALRADRDEDRAKLEAVQADLGRFKEEAARDRLARFELVHWARAVVALLTRHGIPFPPPPPGVSETDPGLTPVDHP